MDRLNIILSLFLIEFVVDVLVLRVFKICYRKTYLLFLQIPKVCGNVLCLFYFNNFLICLIVKFVSLFLCILFLTDSFSFKKLCGLLFLEISLFFSVSGFSMFVLSWINGSLNFVILQKFAKKYQYLILFLIFLYIFAVFKLVRAIEKNRFLKKFLVDVSFCFSGKHINLYGLIDSGNMLFDPLTRKPIVLVSVSSLEKYFSKTEIDDMLKSNFRKIRCDTISGSGYEIPIFKVEDFLIKCDAEKREFLCLIGVVSHRFEKGKIDCLLHRDFL